MKQITPFLWFDKEGEDAARFYVSIFKNSSIDGITYYNEHVAEVAGGKAGAVLTVNFTLDGNRFVALNGGPAFKFTEAVSFMIECENQEEIDYYWSRLTADGGEESMCGWCKDKFGLSWQVTPKRLNEMITDQGERGQRAMAAMMTMKKLDLPTLERAFNGETVPT